MTLDDIALKLDRVEALLMRLIECMADNEEPDDGTSLDDHSSVTIEPTPSL